MAAAAAASAAAEVAVLLLYNTRHDDRGAARAQYPISSAAARPLLSSSSIIFYVSTHCIFIVYLYMCTSIRRTKGDVLRGFSPGNLSPRVHCFNRRRPSASVRRRRRRDAPNRIDAAAVDWPGPVAAISMPWGGRRRTSTLFVTR